MKLRVYSQLPYAEKGLIDDCGPSALAAAIAFSSKGLLDPGVKASIEAAGKAGRVDRFGKSDGTSFAQIVAAGKYLGASVVVAPTWAKALSSMKAGKAILVAFRAPLATPKNAISIWQKGNAKRHPGHSYAHMATMAWVDGSIVFGDPTMSGKGVEEFGVPITEAEAKALVLWGIGVENARRRSPMAWVVSVKTKTVAPVPPTPVQVPTPVAPVVARVSLDEVLDAKLVAPVKAVQVVAPKKAKDESEFREEIDALGRVDWGSKADEAGKILARGLEETRGKKMIDKIKWIFANTGIEEAALEAVRVGLSTGIAVMLATGAPILDMTAADFRVVASAAIAATLQVVVRMLNPQDQAFGVGKAKAVRAAEKLASLGTRAK